MNVNASIDSILQTSLERLAEIGVAEAQYRLGKQYQEGDTLPEDQEMAFGWMMKAAEGEHPRALLEVALSLTRGVGVSIDMPRAVEYYERAAKHDVMEAAWRLGDILLDGRGVMKDPAKARVYYEQACNSKDRVLKRPYSDEAICPEAEWSLGVMLEDGVGGSKNLDEAKKHYSRVTGVKEVKDRDLSALELRYARLIDKGSNDFDSYRVAAEAGSLTAMREYVIRSATHIIRRGRDEDYDPFSETLFQKCLRTLIECHDRKAILLGCEKIIGTGHLEPKFAIENNNCFKVLWPLIHKFDEDACQMLARTYARGIGVERSIFNEIRCYRLALRCKKGRVGNSNSVFKKKLRLLLSGCESDDGRGEYGVWLLLTEEVEVLAPMDSALPWLVDAVKKGCIEAIKKKHEIDYAVARRKFAPKISGLERSDPYSGEAIYSSDVGKDSTCSWDLIFDYILRSAELGDHEAETWAARILSEGRVGDCTSASPKPIKKDVQSAIIWYERAMVAVDLPLEDLWRYTNCLVENGCEDQVRITQLFAKIADAGFYRACLPYAQRLIGGVGCEKNMDLAKFYLHKVDDLVSLDMLSGIYEKEDDNERYYECCNRIMDQYDKVISEYEDLERTRRNLWGPRRKTWEMAYASQVERCAIEKKIILAAAKAMLKNCYVNDGLSEQMKKAWKCLSCDPVTFPDFNKEAITNSTDRKVLDDDIPF